MAAEDENLIRQWAELATDDDQTELCVRCACGALVVFPVSEGPTACECGRQYRGKVTVEVLEP